MSPYYTYVPLILSTIQIVFFFYICCNQQFCFLMMQCYFTMLILYLFSPRRRYLYDIYIYMQFDAKPNNFAIYEITHKAKMAEIVIKHTSDFFYLLKTGGGLSPCKILYLHLSHTVFYAASIVSYVIHYAICFFFLFFFFPYFLFRLEHHYYYYDSGWTQTLQ